MMVRINDSINPTTLARRRRKRNEDGKTRLSILYMTVDAPIVADAVAAVSAMPMTTTTTTSTLYPRHGLCSAPLKTAQPRRRSTFRISLPCIASWAVPKITAAWDSRHAARITRPRRTDRVCCAVDLPFLSGQCAQREILKWRPTTSSLLDRTWTLT